MATRRNRALRLGLEFLNQPFFLFLMGTVCLGATGTFISERRQCLVDLKETRNESEMLDTEIAIRGNAVIRAMTAAKSPEEVATLRSGAVPSTFKEFEGQTLNALMHKERILNRRLEVRQSTLPAGLQSGATEWVDVPDFDRFNDVLQIEYMKAAKSGFNGDLDDDLLEILAGPRYRLNLPEAGHYNLELQQWIKLFAKEGSWRIRGGCGLKATIMRSLGLSA